MVTSVVSNLSHSDYLNIPVTVDNTLLATKKKGQSYIFVYLANNNAIVTGRSNFLCLEKQAFSQQFSHTSEHKFKVSLA